MSALRWWLLILGVLFFSGLTFWELRRPRQARGGEAPEPTRPREPALQLPEMHAHEGLTMRDLPVVELPADPDDEHLHAPQPQEAQEEPLAQDEPIHAEQPMDAAPPPHPEEEAVHAPEFEVSPASSPGDEPPPAAAAEPLVDWPPDDQRRVVALRLVAAPTERFGGRSLRQALAAEGFVLGRFDIFHKPDEARRAVVSAASLSRPGTFDAETMDSQHFGGLSLFAVLPGPMSPPQAFEELVSTARSLNDRLCGVLQDEGGTPLTPARIASLRARLNSGAPA